MEASADGRPVPLGGGKPRALLAMLALEAGSTVSTQRLIDGLWGEQPPATATKLVQVYVSQLRKSLAAGGDGAEIGARAEVAVTGAGDDRAADPGVLADLGPDRLDRLDHAAVQGVASLGPVEADVGDVVPLLIDEALERGGEVDFHSCPLRI
jgi:hypothetical protein